MNRSTSRPIPWLAGLALLVAVPASAQVINPGNFANGAPNGGRPAQTRRQETPPPPALPGSRVEANEVAPPERTPSEMPPTEALFDAINRGDLNGAKDAVARGADLNGRNVLGLTPLELSVDLGRNSISFMLLSYRGASGYSSNGGPSPAPAPTTRQANRAERRAAERADRAAEQAERARSRPVAETAPAPAPQAPRRFAGDGGTPVPQAGFLGFGSAR